MDPLLFKIPETIETARLLLCAPRSGDTAAINAGVLESFDELHEWMPWAKERPSLNDTEFFSRRSAANFILRQELNYRIRLKTDDEFAGCVALFNIDWTLPRFEIGYWLRTPLRGNGYMTEAVLGLAQMAVMSLNANRVEIRCDEKNVRSRAIPERLSFRLEGVLRNDSRTPAGGLRNTCLYAANLENEKRI